MAEKLNLTLLRGTFRERQGEWLERGTSGLQGTRPQPFGYAPEIHDHAQSCNVHSHTVCTMVISGENAEMCSYFLIKLVLALTLI